MDLTLKRILSAVLLAAMLLASLSACAKEEAPPKKDGNAIVNVDPTAPLQPLAEGQGLAAIPNRAPNDGKTRKNTVLVYVMGTDLETNNGCASADLLEMIDSGVDTSKTNVVVYTGGTRSWQLSIPSDCNTIFYMTAGDLMPVAATQQPLSMGDPATLVDFINYAYTAFPAENYSLIFWDHGTGPLYGYGSDELFDGDRLYLYELENALENSPFKQKKLDILGFDACLMGCVEAAEMADKYARYLVASEELESGIGWDYSFLQTYNTTSDPKQIASAILSAFDKTTSSYKWGKNYTLSCLDLSVMPGVNSAMDGLFNKMAAGVTSGGYSKLAKARAKTFTFAPGTATPLDIVDFFDLLDNIDRQDSSYKTETDAMRAQLRKLVVSQVTDMVGPQGVALYFPYESKEVYQNAGSVLLPYTTNSSGYKKFVETFADYWINGEPEADWSQHQVQETTPPATQPPETQPAATEPPATQPPASDPIPSGSMSLQLSQEQLASLSAVTYTVFSSDTDPSSGQTVLTPVLRAVPLEPDSSGKVYVPADPKLVMLRTDEEDKGILWPSARTASMGGVHYVARNGRLMATLDTVDGMEEIVITFSEGNTGRMNTLSVTNASDGEIAGRSEPQLEHWDYIASYYKTYYPTYSTNGVLKPYVYWDDSGDEYYDILSFDRDFWFEQVSLSQLEGDFYCQVVLTDTQGNYYGSGLAKFQNSSSVQRVTVDEMVFDVYADHAELVEYVGKGGAVHIPDRVSGINVTRIGDRAFYYDYNVTSVDIPATVLEIGSEAFASCKNLTQVLFLGNTQTIRSRAFFRCGLTYLVLPASISRIEYQAFASTALLAVDLPANVSFLGAGVFSDCAGLVGITIGFDANGTGSHFKTVNGSLLTADGKELVQAPLGGGVELTIPSGVQRIRSSAVRGSDTLQRVIFPESLKVIESYAFYDTVGLTELTLPAGLESVGHSAFSTFSVGGNEASAVTSIHLGAQVQWVGYDAFDAYPIAEFTVDSGNRSYSAKNGCLLNKSGTLFVQAPYAMEGVLEIPAGVSHVGFHALNRCDGITQLLLSDSVVSMDEYVGLPEKLEKLTVGSGLKRWDNVTDTVYIETVEIPVTNHTFSLVGGDVYSKDLSVFYVSRSTAPNVYVLDSVTTVAPNAFCPKGGSNSTTRSITFADSVNNLTGETFKGMTALESIYVPNSSPYYSVDKGLLYTKDGTQLIACPQALTGTVSVKAGTVIITPYAFSGSLKADRVVLPGGVTAIRRGNFTGYRSGEPLVVELPASLTDIYPDMFYSPSGYRVKCPAGSNASVFATARGVEIVK